MATKPTTISELIKEAHELVDSSKKPAGEIAEFFLGEDRMLNEIKDVVDECERDNLKALIRFLKPDKKKKSQRK